MGATKYDINSTFGITKLRQSGYRKATNIHPDISMYVAESGAGGRSNIFEEKAVIQGGFGE